MEENIKISCLLNEILAKLDYSSDKVDEFVMELLEKISKKIDITKRLESEYSLTWNSIDRNNLIHISDCKKLIKIFYRVLLFYKNNNFYHKNELSLICSILKIINTSYNIIDIYEKLFKESCAEELKNLNDLINSMLPQYS